MLACREDDGTVPDYHVLCLCAGHLTKVRACLGGCGHAKTGKSERSAKEFAFVHRYLLAMPVNFVEFEIRRLAIVQSDTLDLTLR